MSREDDGRAGPSATSPVGPSLPLGFLALAAGSVMLSGLQLQWIPPAQSHTVAVILLAFVPPLQLLSSILAFVSRDPVAGTAMALLAGSWTCIGMATLIIPAGDSNPALGLLLAVGAVLLLLPAVAAVREKPVGTAVMTITALRFGSAAVAHLVQAPAWLTVSGVIGVALAVAALGAAAVLLLADVRPVTSSPART
ncbi:GPR1/FUN34/YaaH family transporter [Nakamurella alba]|uniref:GPR1/FUN34/YaaH family transporter n=1 Tax=Nakamurella alba TaxID=2665158 RepID=UPI0018AA3521|nr:GPR1/FUN34/YaaH family transporter [Nakamurella alba]